MTMNDRASTYTLMTRRHRAACPAFAWIGQSFAHCDDCGEPYWDHTHRYALGDENRQATTAGPFAPSRHQFLKVITRKEADAVRAKWEDA
jgi:hypothetical protein